MCTKFGRLVLIAIAVCLIYAGLVHAFGNASGSFFFGPNPYVFMGTEFATWQGEYITW